MPAPGRLALIDSGLGLLPVAAACWERRPDLELVISMDPDHMPWGARSEEQVAERALAAAEASLAYRPDVLVVACNAASVSALERLRRRLEPEVPVVGTVPPIKPAAEAGRPFAVWATLRTTGSRYQRDLLDRFAGGIRNVEVGCRGLAEAIERGDEAAVAGAVTEASAATPGWVEAVVLGCTHYGLIRDRIAGSFAAPPPLYDNAEAVAVQTLRRLDGLARRPSADRPGERLVTLESGRRVGLPARALRYPAGGRLARLAGMG